MEKTIISYYSNFHGPVLYIGAKSMEFLIRMRDAVACLKDGDAVCIKFHQFTNIEISGFCTFLLVKVERDIDTYTKICNGSDIVWAQTNRGLERTLHLIDYMIKSNTSGHQLLDEDELLIELSYKE